MIKLIYFLVGYGAIKAIFDITRAIVYSFRCIKKRRNQKRLWKLLREGKVYKGKNDIYFYADNDKPKPEYKLNGVD